MAIDESVMQLRTKLFALRDHGLEFLTQVERFLKGTVAADFESVRVGDLYLYRNAPSQNYWLLLPTDYTETGIQLRTEVRQVMAEIASVAQRGILVDKADLIALGQNAKRASASMRLRKFSSWGIRIHHDEGSYIGADPPSQSEDDATIDVCRDEFTDALESTFELLQVLSARNETTPFQTDGPVSLKTYRPGTAFIMMRINPQQPELKDVRDTVAEVFKSFGVSAVRADDLEHSEGITERIIQQIRESEYLFADLTYERPSVYYEIGYAHAIGKAPMLYRKKETYVHFDLAYRNCPEYENLGQLRDLLNKRLSALTGRNPSK
jgi:hypothetical protein